MINSIEFSPVSIVNHDNMQLVKLKYDVNKTFHAVINVYNDATLVKENTPVAFSSGKRFTYILLPAQEKGFLATWQVLDKEGNVLYETKSVWEKVREWTLNLMLSSHTDIGLHNSQYVQRYNSSEFLDKAMKLCDETDGQDDKYRYIAEGTWFINNYGMDRDEKAKENLVENYIKKNKIGVCSGVAGNMIQTYGLEEMCRSTYERKRLKEEWKIGSETMTMIDNNGLPMSMIQPYSDAGYKNIVFAPNQWAPITSTIWQMDTSIPVCECATDAGGGGSRIDVSYYSKLPMVFYWEDENKNRLFVWASAHYNRGSIIFGLIGNAPYNKFTYSKMLQNISDALPLMEEKYPYNTWLSLCYFDDQEPELNIIEAIKEWNKNWKYPHFETVGNLDELFDDFKKKYHDMIPVLKGDITGGWYQLPVSTAEVLSKKFEADRLLPDAEKWATIASLVSDYTYPEDDFRKAWDYLLFNDEHSYGASGYQGRRVYETWMQHNDWIDKATKIAENELEMATKAIADNIETTENGLVVFNPTLQKRTELIEKDGKYVLAEIVPFGYKVIADSEFSCKEEKIAKVKNVENNFYKLVFADNGAITSIYDKELGRELFDNSNYGANEIVYTSDNHVSFSFVEKAEIEAIYNEYKITVNIKSVHKEIGCDIVQVITLPSYEKRIDIENYIYHAKDMVNKDRYKRYIYFAFPFMVENARRLCHLNGKVAEYAKDVTGHGTDVYMAAREWALAENNDFGVALLMKDSQLVEFDHIHPDKTDFGNTGDGSQMFVYAANDWLQMHVSGGTHLNYKFRFSITSYEGSYNKSHLLKMTERYMTPVSTVPVKVQKGCFKEAEKSFLETDTYARLLCLKKADDSQGVIARFYGADGEISINEIAQIKTTATKCSIDEAPIAMSEIYRGFSTYRIGENDISISGRIDEPVERMAIGEYYTGLITKPRAVSGENPGQLYLLWGYNKEEEFSHYKLYRSKEENFLADESTFVADIYLEEYVVGRYVDTDLENNTKYYYKVCAIDKNGNSGRMSEEFCAYTKEILSDTKM